MRHLGMWYFAGALALAVIAPDKGKGIDKEKTEPVAGFEWLNSHSDPPAVNVSGTWTEKVWHTVILRQREGSGLVRGTGDGWNIHGVVSGTKLYLLFVASSEIAYCAELSIEDAKTIKGAYASGARFEGRTTRPMLLTKTGPPASWMPSNYKAKSAETIEVADFDTRPGLEFGPHHRAALSDETMTALIDSKQFAGVSSAADAVPGAKPPDLRLTGTIIEYNPGNKALRHWVGLGAGQAFIRARVQLVDVATGKVKIESVVEGTLSGGFLGGSPIDAVMGLAKEVAKLARGKVPKPVVLEGPKCDVEGKSWLDDRKGVPEINVDGTWMSTDWGKVILSQKEGQSEVLGTADNWNADGLVSGKKVYLVLSSRGVIAYTAELTLEDPKTLKGGYVKGLLGARTKTKPMLLSK